MFRWKSDPLLNTDWLTSSLDEWIPVLHRDLLHYWEREIDPESKNKWAELSPRYRSWKIRNYGSLPKLILSGELLGTAKISRVGKSIQVEAAHYGLYHMTGTRKMPARPWLGVPDVALNQLARISANNILQTLKKS
jgi:hypothetical protein